VRVIVQRLLILAQVFVHKTPVVIGQRIFRIVLDRHVVIVQRQSGLPAVAIRHTPVVVGDGIVRFKLQGAVKVGNGIVIALQIDKDDAPVAVIRGIGLVEIKRFGKVPDGRLAVAQARIRQAAFVVCLAVGSRIVKRINRGLRLVLIGIRRAADAELAASDCAAADDLTYLLNQVGIGAEFDEFLEVFMGADLVVNREVRSAPE
jgi:hypothetical protein